ncbi:MAG: glycosyltransferase [Nostocaceae cyanobacterium]|nr:glycosyltransferase [Nostocaceae cyanobacterium]
MKILFLDQSGKLGGAELSLTDVANPYREDCLIALFADGRFREWLEQKHIPVKVIANAGISVSKDSGLWTSLTSIKSLIPIISEVVGLAREYHLIYANTQKALVVGAIASFFSRRPLVYHLRDILSPEHFSSTNRKIAVISANRFASLVIANSQATKAAFVTAGGRQEIVEVVYNGFEPQNYQISDSQVKETRERLKLEEKFVVGHFSRLAPWKGQHILIEAIAKSPADVTALLVGDALFGEQDYVQELHQQVNRLGLQDRVRFLGFRSDIPQLMSACDLVAHTSTAPEPFGRVIIEAMLCGTTVVAAKAGGALELVNSGINGFLVTPGEPQELAEVILSCRNHREETAAIANYARKNASEKFNLATTNQQIAQLLGRIIRE